MNVHSLTRENFAADFDRHCVPDVTKVKYAKIYAWALEDARTHPVPFTYDAKQGPVKYEDC